MAHNASIYLVAGVGGFKNTAKWNVSLTCCKIVPRDRTAFETYATN